jgi:iron complex transport system substrate-binding protein
MELLTVMWRRLPILLVALVTGLPVTFADITVTDDAGQVLRLPVPARRIVSLAPHATELLFAAGAGDRVVGVSAFSDYPPPARQRPTVSAGLRLDMERVLALKPDLAVGWRGGNAQTDLEALRSFGIPVFIAEPQRLDRLPDTLIALGRLAGSSTEADTAADRFRTRLAQLRQRQSGKSTVRVFVQISIQPLMTLSYRHMVHELITLCGGRNLFAASELLAPEVSTEVVLLENPDAVLFSDSLGTRDTMQDWWRERVSLRAVREGRLYPMPSDLVLRQSPRVLEGAERLCGILDEARASLARER